MKDEQKFGNINMKETLFAPGGPGGHPKTHPGEYAKNFLKSQMCQMSLSLSQMKNEMRFSNINMKETHFAPGGHSKTHPGEYEKNFLKNQMCQISLSLSSMKN